MCESLFQKNLIVWKRNDSDNLGSHIHYVVSEELNSVETALPHKVEFTPHIVSEELNSVETLYMGRVHKK